MSSEREIDEGIQSIKSAWRREHRARTNLKIMLEQAESENAELKELILYMLVDEERGHNDDDTYFEHVRLAKELGIEVDE